MQITQTQTDAVFFCATLCQQTDI